MSLMIATAETVTIGDRTFPYEKPWSGQPLVTRGYLALDTETEVIPEDHAIPRLAMAAACAGDQASCLIHPDQVGAFLLAHPQVRWVFHNAAFDFWVVDRHLRERGEEQALAVWWEACDQGRMSDSMLLDMLIELARRDADPRRRDLATVGKAYARLEISKDDPYRMRYGEIVDKDWAGVEEGFFSYAIRDAIVTFHTYRAMVLRAHLLVHDRVRLSPDLREDALARFGVLSETIQLKGAVALAQISRNGMHLDRAAVEASEADLRGRLDAAVERLRELSPDLFRTCRDGTTGEVALVRTAGGAPSRSNLALQQQLERVVEEIGQESGTTLEIPRTANGLSQSAKVWTEHRTRHPFLQAWTEFEGVSKLCQFFGGLHEPVVHPRYRGLVRTGRTSCSNPNLQQIPRDSRFRQVFVPSPGHLLLAIDYSYIELRTLAAVCQQRYGRSVLADVIRQGVDPHCYTAALILDVPLEEFMSWKDDESELELNGKRQSRRKHFKQARQFAKPVNFGVPGGLGAASLVSYAANTYKVELTLEQAEAFRTKLISEI